MMSGPMATTAVPITSIDMAPRDIPSTPNPYRPRSDTILTTSSASTSSSPQLQTPQTPSILGVLDSYSRHRSDSYGFSDFGKTLFQDGSMEGLSDPEAVQDRERAEVEEVLSPRVPFNLRSAGIISPPPVSEAAESPTSEPADSSLDYFSSEVPSGTGTSKAPAKGKQRAMSSMRAKLQRSRSSFKDILKINGSTSSIADSTDGATTSDPTDVSSARIRPRLRSLLSKSGAGSRASSTTSIRTLSGLVSDGPVRLTPSSTILEQLPTSRTPDSAPVIAEQDVVDPAGQAPNAQSMSPQSPGLDDGTKSTGFHDHILITPPRIRRCMRPTPVSALSSSRILQYTTPAPPITRSATDPVVVEGSFETPATWQDMPKKDSFTTMLPQELKVMVIKTVLDMGKDGERHTRWDGEVGARKELIRLSRVSKAWQALCFDGQLWPVVDLAPFVSVLQPRTLARIINHSGPFIRTLSLHGMDALKGSALVSVIAQNRPNGEPVLSNLTTLDLRGCKNLHSDSLVSLIDAAPNLRVVNFKGVQAVSSEVIRALARDTTSLESLDVSRCWDVSLCDLCVFIKMLSPEQAGNIKVFRAGGLRAYGHGSDDFLPLVMDRLVNLETLDLLGCTHILDDNMISAVTSLTEHSRRSSLHHLNLSGCVSLTADIFPSMRDMFPELTRLELASVPGMFGENGDGEKGFHDFLRSLTKLEKLDLDGTGHIGGVNDKMLAILTSPKGETNDLNELRIGYAKGVTPEGLIRFIRGCPALRHLEADNTSATNAVMREFYRRHSHDASITLVDCRAITPVAYSHLSSSSRPRDGTTGYSTIPMGYNEGELDNRVVIKVFWSWRRVGVVKGWREALRDKEKEHAEFSAGGGSSNVGIRSPAGRSGRGKGWWKNNESFDDDRAGCVVQ